MLDKGRQIFEVKLLSSVCCPGDPIQGTVLLDAQTASAVDRIALKVFGSARVSYDCEVIFDFSFPIFLNYGYNEQLKLGWYGSESELSAWIQIQIIGGHTRSGLNIFCRILFLKNSSRFAITEKIRSYHTLAEEFWLKPCHL